MFETGEARPCLSIRVVELNVDKFDRNIDYSLIVSVQLASPSTNWSS